MAIPSLHLDPTTDSARIGAIGTPTFGTGSPRPDGPSISAVLPAYNE